MSFPRKVVLPNIWTTAGASCIKESPALDHLVTAVNGELASQYRLIASGSTRSAIARRAEPDEIVDALKT